MRHFKKMREKYPKDEIGIFHPGLEGTFQVTGNESVSKERKLYGCRFPLTNNCSNSSKCLKIDSVMK